MRSATALDPISLFLANQEQHLPRIDSLLSVCQCPIDVAWTVADFAGRNLDLDDCIVYLMDADGSAVSQYAAWGAKRVAERVLENRIRLKLGQGIVGTCAWTGAPQVALDTRLDPRYVLDDAMRLSELAVPMRDGNVVRGVIDSEHAAADHFRSAHIRALLLIAGRAAKRLGTLVTKP
jgi:GAF domain-containing protein